MNEFFQRLKQRKLVQWAIAYVAAAFASRKLMAIATRAASHFQFENLAANAFDAGDAAKNGRGNRRVLVIMRG